MSMSQGTCPRDSPCKRVHFVGAVMRRPPGSTMRFVPGRAAIGRPYACYASPPADAGRSMPLRRGSYGQRYGHVPIKSRQGFAPKLHTPNSTLQTPRGLRCSPLGSSSLQQPALGRFVGLAGDGQAGVLLEGLDGLHGLLAVVAGGGAGDVQVAQAAQLLLQL